LIAVAARISWLTILPLLAFTIAIGIGIVTETTTEIGTAIETGTEIAIAMIGAVMKRACNSAARPTMVGDTIVRATFREEQQ